MKSMKNFFKIMSCCSLLVIAPFVQASATCDKHSAFTDSRAGIPFICNCNTNSGPAGYSKDNEGTKWRGKQSGVSTNAMAFDSFPNVRVCQNKGSFGRWSDPEERMCAGFTVASFNANTMNTVAQRKGALADCWKYECKDKSAVFNATTGECSKRDPNLEYDTAGNPVPPCDTETPTKINVGGTSTKTVPSNTRLDGKCIPTCQSDSFSSIDLSDPTEFKITLTR